MSRKLKEIRTNTNEDLVEAIKEAVDYCNKYYNCFYVDDDDDDEEIEDYIEEDDKEDARILLALQDRAISLMKRATYREMDLAFPLDTDAFDDTQVYEYELSTNQNVLEYIKYREDNNRDFAVFMELRTQARIILDEF